MLIPCTSRTEKLSRQINSMIILCPRKFVHLHGGGVNTQTLESSTWDQVKKNMLKGVFKKIISYILAQVFWRRNYLRMQIHS